MRNIGIAARLSMLFAVLAALAIALAGAGAYYVSKSSFADAARNNLNAHALREEATLRQISRQHRTVLKFLAESPWLYGALAGETSPDLLQATLAPNLRVWSQRHFVSFEVAAADGGRVLVATEPRELGKLRGRQAYFSRGLLGANVQHIAQDRRQRRPVMYVSAPIRASETAPTLGVLIGKLALATLEAAVQAGNPAYETLDVYVVDRFRFPLTQLRFIDEDVVPRRQLESAPVEACVAGRSGLMVAPNHRGTRVFAAYRWMESEQLCLLAELEEAEVYEPLDAVLAAILGTASIAALLALAGSGLLGKGATRSISAVRRAADRYISGDKSARVSHFGPAEIGELGQSFNRLADTVARRERELEERAEELRQEVGRRASAEHKAKEALETLQAAQEKMVQVEKLSAVGTFVGGIAHEINNPLMGVTNYVSYARSRMKPGKPHDMLGRALEEIARISRILKNLLLFARSAPQPDLSAAVPEVLAKVQDLMAADLRAREVTLTLDVAQDLPAVACGPDALQQVLLNLLVNARDAVEGRHLREVGIVARAEGESVLIQVRDSGPGIAESARSRLFDAFFTTKPPDKGTGLGLSVSAQIASSAGGRLDCENGAGGGAVFTVTLPFASTGEQPVTCDSVGGEDPTHGG